MHLGLCTLAAAAAAAAAATAAPSLPWPFSWATVPSFAFPGPAVPSGARFMTPAEEAAFVSNYSMLLTWGANATCVRADGSTFAPSCRPSVCYCDEADPLHQRWVPDMEAALLAQGAALKARAAALGKPRFPVLGYIEGLSAQQWYRAQAALLSNDSFTPYLLSVESRGLIDCFRDGCNWQGVEARQLDLRQPRVLDYFVNTVVRSAVDGPGLDGVFIDCIEWWLDACATWPCTAAEAASLVNASLVASDAVLAAAAGWGKVVSLSSHTTLASQGEYYRAYADTLARYPGTAIRFYEFWAASDDFVATLVHETQVLGLPVHVHADKRTLAPDWVELAAFLVGAGEYSYFSWSVDWMLDSWAAPPEFARPLGPPAGPPVRAEAPPERFAPWALVPAQNLVFDAVSCRNCSAPGVVAFVGTAADAAACLAAARAAFPAATGMTWVDGGGGDYALACYARVDAAFAAAAAGCVLRQTAAAPCYAQPQATAVSAAAAPVQRNGTAVWTRPFARVDVTYVVGNHTATLAWR